MALPSADEQRTLRKGMPFLSVRSFTLTNSELITKKTIYTKILTLPIRLNKSPFLLNINMKVPIERRKLMFYLIYCMEIVMIALQVINQLL